MTSIIVQDFKAGLDQRRLAVTAAPGTLRKLRNAHVNRGGEIEKRRAFLRLHNFPAGTFGLAGIAGSLFTFGSEANTGQTNFMQIGYQQLTSASGAAMARILSVEPFSGKLYVIAEFVDGSVHQFYDGTRLTNFVGREGAEQARIAKTYRNNVYVATGPVLVRSADSGATDFSNTGIGGALFDMSTQAAGSEVLTGIGTYGRKLAIFSRRTVQIWGFVADPAGSLQEQILPNIGTVSPRSVVSFAESDVFFLADSGVRSLRARDSSNTAATSDVGTPIDDQIVALVRTMTPAQREAIHAAIEPTDGRYWLAIGSTIFAFSFFPGAKVSAWSTYDLPAVSDAIVPVDNQVYVRAGGALYVYGGSALGPPVFDDSTAEVEMAYLDGRQVAAWKGWTGLDITAEGTWQIFAAFDPNQPDVEDLIATIRDTSAGYLTIPMNGWSPTVKLRLVSQGTGAARIGSVVAHYDTQGAR